MDDKTHAQSLQKNPLLPRLLDELAGDFVGRWKSSDTTTAREQCWHVINALEAVREHVESRIRELAGDGE